jgi:cytochrome c oxidase subunit 2
MKTGQFDIVCAELCGWGHYKMKGRMTVESPDDFQKWLADTQTAQEQDSFAMSEGE